MEKSWIFLTAGLLIGLESNAQPVGYGRGVGHTTPRLSVRTPAPVPVMQPEYEAEYRFPISLEITGITYHRNGKRQETEVRYYFNPQRDWMATAISDADRTYMRSMDALSIFDFQNNSVLLLTPAQKSGMVMLLNPASSVQNAASGKPEEAWKCYRTGKRRVLLALQCEECICMDDERKSSATLWVTRDLPVNLAPTTVRCSPFNQQFRVAQKAGGVLVLGNFYENGTLKTSLQMSSLDRSAGLVFSLDTYNVR